MQFLDIVGVRALWTAVKRETAKATSTVQGETAHATNAYVDVTGTAVPDQGDHTNYVVSLHNVASLTDVKNLGEKLYGGVIPTTGAVTMSSLNTRIDDLEDGFAITVEKLATAESGYSASYVVKQNNVRVGETINIPKDYLVKSATIATVTTAGTPYAGAVVGDKYIDFVVNTVDTSATAQHIYLPVNDLVDVYTAGNGIAISNTNVVSAKIDSTSEFFTVGANGLKVSGISDAIDDAVSDAKDELVGLNSDTSSKNTIKGAKAYADEKAQELLSAMPYSDWDENVSTSDAYVKNRTHYRMPMKMIAIATPLTDQSVNSTYTSNKCYFDTDASYKTLAFPVLTSVNDLQWVSDLVIKDVKFADCTGGPVMVADYGDVTFSKDDVVVESGKTTYKSSDARISVVADSTVNDGYPYLIVDFNPQLQAAGYPKFTGIITPPEMWDGESYFYTQLDGRYIPVDGTTITLDANNNLKAVSSITVDSVPTSGSSNAVSSNGVFAALASKPDDDNVVHKTGAETVNGVKTFVSKPKFNAGIFVDNSSSTVTNHGATIKYDDAVTLSQAGASERLTLVGPNNEMLLTGIKTPENDKDAANKKYVDDAVKAKWYGVTSALPYLAIEAPNSNKQAVYVTVGNGGIKTEFCVLLGNNQAKIVGSFDENDNVEFYYCDNITGFSNKAVIISAVGTGFNVLNVGSEETKVKLVDIANPADMLPFTGELVKQRSIPEPIHFHQVASSTNLISGSYAESKAAAENGIPSMAFYSYVDMMDHSQDWMRGYYLINPDYSYYDGANTYDALLYGRQYVDTDADSPNYKKLIYSYLIVYNDGTNDLCADQGDAVEIDCSNKADKVTVATTIPATGLKPNVFYNLGTLSANTTFTLAASTTVADEYMIQFSTGATAPTITWPTGIAWFGGSAPAIDVNKTYQISIQNGLAVSGEF